MKLKLATLYYCTESYYNEFQRQFVVKMIYKVSTILNKPKFYSVIKCCSSTSLSKGYFLKHPEHRAVP